MSRTRLRRLWDDWLVIPLFLACWATHYPFRHRTMDMTNGQKWCPTCLRPFGRKRA